MTHPTKIRLRGGERPIFPVATNVTQTELNHVDELARIRGVSRSAVLVEGVEVLWALQAQRVG